MNLQEALAKITELQHLIGVYEELSDHLEQFLPSDLGESEAELILEGSFESAVSADVIDCVLQELQAKKAEAENQLIDLHKMRVTSGQTKKNSTTAKKPTTAKSKKK